MNPFENGFVKAPTSAEEETPAQRDRAVTIFERSVEGRRAAQLPEVQRGRNARGDAVHSVLGCVAPV